MPDPSLPGIGELPICPRVGTAPVIERPSRPRARPKGTLFCHFEGSFSAIPPAPLALCLSEWSRAAFGNPRRAGASKM